MGKLQDRLLLLCVLAVAAIAVFSFFHVPGSLIKGQPRVSLTSSVVVEKRTLNKPGKETFRLDQTQIAQLKRLLFESSYTRNLASSISFTDRDFYSILIDDTGQQFWLYLDSQGGEYLSVSGQFGGKFLWINRPGWKESLEDILSRTDS